MFKDLQALVCCVGCGSIDVSAVLVGCSVDVLTILLFGLSLFGHDFFLFVDGPVHHAGFRC